MSQISLTDIHKQFPGSGGKGGWKALDGVTFEIGTGEIVGLLGPSGCGKSTLLNIVAGLDGQYEGTVTIQGRSIAEQIDRGFRIAYVFQEARLMPWRTLRQNIEFVLEASDFARSEWAGRIDKVLGLVELSKFADFFPLQLSGGMQQRASIARAFAIEPDILLMDEPFSALDELTARRLRQSLLNIWSAFRTTILFVSHNAFESTFLGDRVLVMSPGPGGKIKEEISLRHIRRPRDYEDSALFEQSKRVVESLQRHVGDRTEEN
ncbi:MAG: ABC transporter ATP-binding protein [Mesorhizobium sp.]|nr:ABC transporter ATP-binding protein [Mesorhizobium sp.]MCO5160965.1 ABC transporter ATP-binding protein [Mesorhizobium sp.]